MNAFDHDQNRRNQPDSLRSAVLPDTNLKNVRICDKNSVTIETLVGDCFYFELNIRRVVPDYLYFVAYFNVTRN